MHTYRIADAAVLPSVGANTVGHLVDTRELTAERDGLGRRINPGPALAAYEGNAAAGAGVHQLLCRHRRTRGTEAEPAVLAVAVIKSTNVVVEGP
jgi:hypothetical protein